jgi:ATP-binding protein involved in chromosome partitioning
MPPGPGPGPAATLEKRPPIAGVKNLVAVASGKGGVGKTTVAVNLAIALKKLGATVGLLDADVYGPNVPVMLGTNEQPRALDDKTIIPVEAYGVKMISMGLLNPGDKPLVWRGPMLHSVMQQFLRSVQWGALDYLIVDLPPGTGDVQLSLIQSVSVTGAVVVTTPSIVALADVRKAVEMFRQVTGALMCLATARASTWPRISACRFWARLKLTRRFALAAIPASRWRRWVKTRPAVRAFTRWRAM